MASESIQSLCPIEKTTNRQSFFSTLHVTLDGYRRSSNGGQDGRPITKSNYDLNIVLVGITHPGNLGAICRTMLNHGFDKLSIGQSKLFAR